jgi:hypothetical protein
VKESTPPVSKLWDRNVVACRPATGHGDSGQRIWLSIAESGSARAILPRKSKAWLDFICCHLLLDFFQHWSCYTNMALLATSGSPYVRSTVALVALRSALASFRISTEPSTSTGRRHASHQAQGRANGPKDSAGKRLGAKKADGQYVVPGNILFKQRGTLWYPGDGCSMVWRTMRPASFVQHHLSSIILTIYRAVITPSMPLYPDMSNITGIRSNTRSANSLA